MRLTFKLIVAVFVVAAAGLSVLNLRKPIESSPSKPTLSIPSPEDQKTIADNFGRIPLHFERNQGQADSSVGFISRNGGRALLLGKSEARLVLPNFSETEKRQPRADAPDILTMKLVDASADPTVEGMNPLPARSNYFKGNDPKKWQADVQTYEKVKYTGVYQGVDLVYYGNQTTLEYDFHVAPNVDPNVIRMKFDSATDLKVEENGDLNLSVGSHVVRQHAPIVYQEIDGVRKAVEAGYVVSQNEKVVGFSIGEYDRSKALTIDPVVTFSTYLGGSAGSDFFPIESGFALAVDPSGNIFVAGITPSGDFPTQSPAQPSSAGIYDAFITKYNPSGSALLYSSYFGGNDEDRIVSISLGPSNEIFASGFTLSTNFPLMTPLQTTLNGFNDAFIAKFSSTGALAYSTYLGGSSAEACLFIKNQGTDVVTFAGSTQSVDFPVFNAIQGNNAGGSDFFLGKLNMATNTLVFSTYFGGTFNDSMILSTAAVDDAGNIYIGGTSGSIDYPTTVGAFQTESGGSDEVVITKFNSLGNAIFYSTYIGGNLIDDADGLTIDSSGNAYVTGFTRSANYPVKNAVQPVLKDPDSFVTKLNATGTDLVFSTYLGGLNLERGSAVATDAAGNCYVTGRSNSGDFPSKRALRPPRGLDDVFVSKFNRDGALLFSTLLGGNFNDYGFAIIADNFNNAIVTGRATRNYLITPGALQPTMGGEADAFLTKINTSVRKVRSDFEGDSKTDIGVYRPSTGVWYSLRSSTGVFNAQPFGMAGDVPVPGDYDADGKTDTAVFRPSEGIWYILNSRTNTLRAVFWGVASDKLVQGDYDGDDKTDVAVYRPSTSVWYIILSSTNGLRTATFGLSGDKPVPADYDGDGVTDIATYQPANGLWSIVGSFLGIRTMQFGLSSDKPVPADYDGDGYDDIAVYRPSDGTWYIVRSGVGNSLLALQWGVSTDIPSPGEFDGDGKEDVAVFRPSNGAWYVLKSSNGALFATVFGLSGDVPVTSAYVAQ
jgi:hypothetical protein